MRQASFPLLLPLFVCKNSCSVIDVGFYLLDLCISLSESISICHWREHSQCYGDQGKTNFVYFHNYKRKIVNPYYSLFKYLSRIAEIFLDLPWVMTREIMVQIRNETIPATIAGRISAPVPLSSLKWQIDCNQWKSQTE